MKTLRQELLTLTEEQLDTIFALWAVPGTGEHTKAKRLDLFQQEVRDLVSARFVWEHLSPDEQVVLYHVGATANRYGIDPNELQRKTRLPQDRFQATLKKLQDYLLFYEDTHYHYNYSQKTPGEVKAKVIVPFSESIDALYATGRELFTPSADRSKKNLSSLFGKTTEVDMFQLMQLYDVPEQGYYSRPEMRDILAEGMMKADDLFAKLPRLDAHALALAHWISAAGGTVTIQSVRDTMKLDDVELAQLIHILIKYALAFDTFSNGTRILFIPHDLYASMTPEARAARRAERETRPLDQGGTGATHGSSSRAGLTLRHRDDNQCTLPAAGRADASGQSPQAHRHESSPPTAWTTATGLRGERRVPRHYCRYGARARSRGANGA